MFFNASNFQQIENLDKQYTEQKLDLEGLQDRLNEISRDR